jgi:tetratricopeptide (TPR) repeat protein
LQSYEALILIEPDAEEERQEEIVARVREIVLGGGGSWDALDPWQSGTRSIIVADPAARAIGGIVKTCTNGKGLSSSDRGETRVWSKVMSRGALLIAPVALCLACSGAEGGVGPTDLTPEAQTEYKVQIELARQMLDKGQAQEALVPLERSRELDPDAFAVQNNYCVAFGILQRRDEAVNACQRALEIDPDSQLAKNNLNWVSGIKPLTVQPAAAQPAKP